MIGELSHEFPWGVLLVTDANSTEEIPQWSSPAETVAVAKSALVVKVRHADEGPVTVRVSDTRATALGDLVFDGPLELTSGVMAISDAIGGAALRIAVIPGNAQVAVFVDERIEATVVDVTVEH